MGRTKVPRNARKDAGLWISLLLGVCLLLGLLPRAAAAAGPPGPAGQGDDFARHFLARYVTTFLHAGNNNFPGDESNVALQTRDGYMWFGGYSGLYRFDGAKFTVWDAVSPNGFNSSNIRSLCEDSDGVLWIGTNDKGLVAYRNGTFTTYGKAAGALSNTIRAIAEGPEGRIYCGTPEGIFYIDRERKITPVALASAVHPFVISLCFDARNNIYAVLNSGELYVYTSDDRTMRCPSREPIDAVAAVSGNRIVAGMREGGALILEFDGRAFTRSEKKDVPLYEFTAIYEDSGGFIWMTGESGIGFFDRDERFHYAGDPSGMGFYSGICEDYQHNYWITATKGGVVKLSESAFIDVNALISVETGTVNAVVLRDDVMYIGTDDSLRMLDASGTPIRTDFTERIKARVRGIFTDSGGNVWICTYSDFGVIRYEPGTHRWVNWLPEDGLVSEKTRCAAELPNGVMAVGTAEGVSFISGDSVIAAREAFGTEAEIELPDVMVLSLAVTPGGTLFMGTDGNGVYTVNREGSARYREEDGLTGGVILRMLANPRENGVWVASSPGLCYIDESGRVTVVDKIQPDTFLDIMQYGDELILLTSSSIIRTNADALLDPELPFEHTSVGRESGLAASISANAWNLITGDGSLYFCRDNGISIYNLRKTAGSFIPYAGISKIDVDGREYTDFSEGLTIPRDADRLTAELACLSYGFLGDAALRCMLVGQDDEAQSLPTDGPLNVSYTNLKGGKYTLQVWTEDASGERGSTVEVGLRKELALLERPSVWACIVLTATLAVVRLTSVIFEQKNKMLYRKQREYRTIISQALNAITRTIDAKDTYTSGHSARVAAYSVEIARRMGMGRDFIENLYYVGLLHDVGKIGIPSAIINKPSKLTEGEFDVMKQHPRIGEEILKEITTIHNLTSGAAEHHERWDGSGYWQGLGGEEISLEARIIAAADTYDAMSSDRPYRGKLPREEILAEFKLCRGSQFDPRIADVVIDLIEQDHMSIVDVNTIIEQIHEGSMQ